MSKKMNLHEVFKKEEEELKTVYSNPNLYINRELSWIEFNKRVLHQATRKEIPLFERLKFLGITSSNLDEFIMVRMSSILNKERRNPFSKDIAGLVPEEEYRKVFKQVLDFKKLQDKLYHSLRKELAESGYRFTKVSKLNDEEKLIAEELFMSQIYPIITPINFDSTKEFPLIRSKQLTVVAGLEDAINPNLSVISFIPIGSLNRVFEIKFNNVKKYILVEELIMHFLEKIFINKKITFRGCVRLVREADIELELESDVYIVDRMKQTVFKREHSDPIFMDVSKDIPKQEMRELSKIFGVKRTHLYRWNSTVDLTFWIGKPIRSMNNEYGLFEAQYPAELIGEHDMFSAIDNGDILLQHPYESFDPVIKFLEHAAIDPDVVAIKQTLYRVSSIDSPIVEALCQAARRGKQVSVLLEIKARFDEERNMSLIDKLNDAGCFISYGDEILKTHAKFIAVVRKDKKKNLKVYAHIGTGNYNDKTAGIYTDLSYFTSNNKIGNDLITIFNVLTGFSEPQNKIKKIFYAPFNIRAKLYDMIEREIKHASKGNDSIIILKLNSLSDKGLISRLYKASENGVKVLIMCRGICSIKPINSNITIRSIIGRYLEHSRIYYFHNDGKRDIFISSADLLGRNLDRRVEIMVPVTEQKTKNKLINILQLFFKDDFNTYTMDKKGAFTLLNDKGTKNIHEYFMKNAVESHKVRRIPKMARQKKK